MTTKEKQEYMEKEKLYEELDRLAPLLHVPIPRAFVTLEVFKGSKLIQRLHQRSHSWTRNAYNMMFSSLAGYQCPDATFEAGKLSHKATSGTIYSGDWAFAMVYDNKKMNTTDVGYLCSAGSNTFGIQVGQGENAEDFEDYVLQTLIAEGTGANQLNHAQSEANVVSYAGEVLSNELVRYFNNNTLGATNVNVNEVGLVCKTYRVSDYLNSFFGLMSRDKLGETVVVPSTGQLKVTYTISLTYPS